MVERNNKPLDLLLLHVPKFNNFYDPIGHFVLGNLLPMGIFGLADATERSGFRTRIYHLGVEFLLTKKFRLSILLHARKPLLVGLDLHWHYQTHDVLEAVRRIKAEEPEILVVLGGYTATIYAEDILKHHPCVDFIIRGEAEKPLVMLLKTIKDGRTFGQVPNLSFRKNGVVQHNPIEYVATCDDLNGLDFARFDLLENAQMYFRQIRHIVWLRSFPRRFNFAFFTPGRMGGYIVPVARGCPVDCANCGGSRSSVRRSMGRERVTFRSIDVVVEELARVHRFGIEDLYFGLDPYPNSSYYPDLFRRIRERNLSFGAVFESSGLPSVEFVAEFKATFGSVKPKHLLLLITPETGSEEHRRSNRGNFFTNSELFATLDMMDKQRVPFQLCYSIGLPGESKETLTATRALWKAAAKRYRNLVSQSATIIDGDPGSPMERGSWDISCAPRTLQETEILHRDSYQGSHTGWGHLPIHHDCTTLPVVPPSSGCLRATDVYLRRYKCRYFCNYFGRLPIRFPLNRSVCKTAGILFRAHSQLFRLARVQY